MAVQIEHFALEAGEGDEIQLAKIQAALRVVVGFFTQGRGQALEQFACRNPLGARFATDQLAQGKGTAPSLQFFAPFIVEAPAFVEHEEHFETGIAKQHVRRLLAGGVEVFRAVGNVQALQQALADPTLALPFARIGEEGVGLFGLNGEQAQIIGVIHVPSLAPCQVLLTGKLLMLYGYKKTVFYLELYCYVGLIAQGLQLMGRPVFPFLCLRDSPMKIRLLSAAVAAAITLVSFGAVAADLAAIKQKGEIVIGTLGTDEPNSFIDPKTRQIVGYEIDLGNEIAKDLGVKPVFKQISVAARIPELQQGRVDILAASLTHNKEREALVDFSYSILITGQKALVKKSSGITALDQLADKKVLTVKGGTQEPNIRKAIPSAQVVTFETSQQALLALQQGKGQAFVDDESALVNDFAKIGSAAAGYSILPENLSNEALAIALPKDSGELKVAVDKTLTRLESSGEAEKLYLKWYGPGTKSNLPARHFKIDSDQVE